MKHKRFFIINIIMLVILMVSQLILPLSSVVTVEAATIKINKKNLTLEVGNSETLKLKDTKQKVAWTSSNKAIATVSKSGKVTAVKAGKTTITAAINKMKYNCAVTVKDNQYITNAPFDAKKTKTGEFEYVIPKNWSDPKNEYECAYLCPKDSINSDDASSVEFYIDDLGTITDYNVMKTTIAKDKTQEKVTSDFTSDLINSKVIDKDTKITYTDFKTSDFKTVSGNAYKIEFNIDLDNKIRSEAIYYFYIDEYCITLYTDDIDDNVTPDAKTVGEYILSSMHFSNK